MISINVTFLDAIFRAPQAKAGTATHLEVGGTRTKVYKRKDFAIRKYFLGE